MKMLRKEVFTSAKSLVESVKKNGKLPIFGRLCIWNDVERVKKRQNRVKKSQESF